MFFRNTSSAFRHLSGNGHFHRLLTVQPAETKNRGRNRPPETAIRTAKHIRDTGRRTETGLSWLFYFKALQNGDVSFVAPVDKLSVVMTIILSFIILKEPLSWRAILGGLMIAGGSLVLLTK